LLAKTVPCVPIFMEAQRAARASDMRAAISALREAKLSYAQIAHLLTTVTAVLGFTNKRGEPLEYDPLTIRRVNARR
jgi:hypothetical protein